MAYRQAERPSQRLVTAAALHAAGIYAVIAGLSIVFIPRVEVPQIAATNEPVPQPTVEPPSPRASADQDHTLIRDPLPVPTAVFTLPPPLPSASASPAGQGEGSGGGTGWGQASPQPSIPAIEPRAAAPLGKPGGWVSDIDYPTSELRLGHAGVVGFQLAIAANGRVSGCTVTRSSSFARLDEVTCRLLKARARFRPAADATGAPTTGTFSSAVRWQIPD